MNKIIAKNRRKLRRKNRTRSQIFGTAKRPRLNVCRTNTSIYVQLINDEKGETLASVHSRDIKNKKANKTEIATEVGKEIAKKAQAKKVSEVIFDRGSYIYHGRVKAVAEGAREGGLKF
ncbi:50S ribosomal protein L18 [Candidatus Parcubacteria bacterium]|nr:MAG: 50S ribosomal protein L18 [Candidatus Parcubacteria bacterium]